jgi:hypothetical protein
VIERCTVMQEGQRLVVAGRGREGCGVGHGVGRGWM